MNQDHEAPHRQLCTFYLDKQLYAIDVADVQEVLRYQEMTRVPLAPRVVSGLINLRGQIVTALDLRMQLGLPPDAAITPTNIVLRLDSGVVSLLVDEIGDVVEVEETSFERTPETLDSIDATLVSGVYKLPHQLLLLLDTRAAATVRTDTA